MHMFVKFYNTILGIIFHESTREHVVNKLYSGEHHIAITPYKNITTSKARVTTIMSYDAKYVRNLIYSLKFYNSHKAAVVLARMLNDFLAENLSDRLVYKPNKIIIAPIPLYKKRKHKRGFNQTERILNELIKINPSIKKFVIMDLLMRNRHTESQVKLNKKDRLKNLQGAFSIQNTSKKGTPSTIRNSHVIIVDDICTTGATLKDADRVLKDAGCGHITLLALAHA